MVGQVRPVSARPASPFLTGSGATCLQTPQFEKTKLGKAMNRLIHAVIATALIAAPALAHDPKLHVGPKVEGKVVSVNGDRLEVGTVGGVVAVTLSPNTTYELEMDGRKAERSVLKDGQEVKVSGHRLGSGEFAASEVMIRTDGRAPREAVSSSPDAPERTRAIHR